jgi:hypothetical protein
MNLTVELPDAIAHQLRLDGPDAPARARELFALQGYESGDLSRRQVGDLLGLSFFETEAFLKAHGGQIPLTPEDVYRDVHGLDALLRQ